VSVRCNPWTHGGTTALIGDAAHAMLPFLGQGMNAGFEDVTVLDQCLELANDDWSDAIDAYQRLRRPDCDTITDLSLAHFAELSGQVADPRFLLQRSIELKFQRMFPERFVPLYARIAFSCMRYTEIARLNLRQDGAIRRIMAVEGIGHRVDSPEVDDLIRELALEL
jgi:kynurenine 3-monooxygenase